MPKNLFTADDLAQHLGVAVKTLAHWRVRGEGPRFARIGGRIAYDPADVRAWVESRKVSSTSAALGMEG